MVSPLTYRDYIVDYLNSDLSKFEGIYLNREELQNVADYLMELHNVREYIEQLRNFNTHNEYLEELKKLVR